MESVATLSGVEYVSIARTNHKMLVDQDLMAFSTQKHKYTKTPTLMQANWPSLNAQNTQLINIGTAGMCVCVSLCTTVVNIIVRSD